MSRYIPNTGTYQKEMLAELGLDSIEELFRDIPENVRQKEESRLPAAQSEIDLMRHMKALARKNAALEEYTCFLGAGAYDHFIPSIVGRLISRQEFYTAYTPYQPEISQGTLQAIFEYQTMICELTGMDVANASMYDGASALAEASNMACNAVKRKEVIISSTINPALKDVLYTYARFNGTTVVEAGYDNGRINLEELEGKVSERTAAVIVQSPNFFGIIESLREAAEIAHRAGALLIASADPISLGVLKAPGDLGADIVAGEGQSLGIPISFGGPYLGFLAARKEHLRRMPGRIAGETNDKDGKRGYVLTVQTREQHIRREKATSNICSNQALCALAAAIYMSALGKQGLREVGNLCLQKAHYAYEKLVATGSFKPMFTAPFFKEFAVRSRIPVKELNKGLLKEKIIGGYEIGRNYPELADGWLVSVTENRTREEIDNMVRKAAAL